METPERPVEARSMLHFLTPAPLSAERTVIESGRAATRPCSHPPPLPPQFICEPLNAQLGGCGRAEPQMSYLWAIFPRRLHIIIKR